jgi:hypothetical protein
MNNRFDQRSPRSLSDRLQQADSVALMKMRVSKQIAEDVPQDLTGTILFAIATPNDGVFLGVSWDCLIQKQRWYREEVLLRSVSLIGAPIRRPVPTRQRTREFTVEGAFSRIGRHVWTVRRPTAAVMLGQAGCVRHVVVDEHGLMVGISWENGTEDASWFSRDEYRFYLSEEMPRLSGDQHITWHVLLRAATHYLRGRSWTDTLQESLTMNSASSG